MKSIQNMMTSPVAKNVKVWATALFAVSLMSSCIKNNFDEPPVNGSDPNLTPTMTIAEFKQLYAGASIEIQDSIILSGVIIADDRSGNFYKTLVIEDSTAGIAIRLDQTGLYNTYMIGRRIFIYTKGLYLGAYAGLVQIGGAATAGSVDEVDPIPSTLISKHIVRGSLNNTVTPTTVTLTSLGNNYQNRLIRLENVQFSPADTGLSYADGTLQQSKNTTIQDCNGNSVILRNSGYATFANQIVPSGKGTLTAVYSVFNNTPQLLIRDVYDLQFDSTRCGGGSSGGSVTLFEEAFDGLSDNVVISLAGWVNQPETGTVKWKSGLAGATGTNPWAECTAYNTGQAVVKSWLITPEIDLSQTTAEKMEFRGTGGFHNGATLKLYISTNYDGGVTPWTATWTELNFNALPTQATGFASFASSGLIDLSAFDGLVRLAWIYQGGTGTNQTTTWEIDNIEVTGEQ
jgi:hypothetical protein